MHSHRTIFTLLLLISSILSPVAALAAAPTTLPSLDDIHTLYDAQRYREALQACLRITSLRDDATVGYNRHPIRMLAAECQLHLKLIAPSLQSLDSIAALEKSTGNSEDAAEATALAFLIRSSPNLRYIPTSGGSDEDRAAIDILDPAGRKQAYDRLLADQLAYCETQQHESRAYESLLPLLDLAKKFEAIRAVERTATHATTQSDRLGRSLGTWSGKIIYAVLNGFYKQTIRISQDTNIGPNHKLHRGRQTPLTLQQIVTLRGFVIICQKVPDAVTTLNRAFAVPLAESDPINRTHAQNLIDLITGILNENAAINPQH